MGFKSAIFFFNLENYGCSERYWHVDPAADLSTVRNKAEKLLNLRCAFLADGVRIAHAYVSDDVVYRDTLPIVQPEYPKDGKWMSDANADTSPDIRTTSLLVRSWSEFRGTKNTYHAMIPDVDITAPTTRPQTKLRAAFLKAVDDFYGSLVADGWGFKGIGGETTNAPSDVLDVNLTIPPPGIEISVGIVPAGLKQGDSIRVYEVRHSGSPKLNGIWYVSDLTAGVIRIPDYESVDFKYIGGGKVQARKQIVWKYTEYKISGATSHKRGPGFLRPVGRRRTPKSR